MKGGYEDYLRKRKESPALRLGRQGYKKIDILSVVEPFFMDFLIGCDKEVFLKR